ncbi:DNA polymerase III subunit delta' [Caldimonas tepidiphila]|uniref:DNA polymerase III subunit delta' n=1 Tax=Caldimonas tepidiphila TaxID=2315841 RepID=UPI000E5B9079|nr:DNA polymerase III subunit delta' [Caldimonas tepidiphila]
MSPLLPWLREPLERLLATQRGHAVLLSGPEGIGQFELALALAQAWLCESNGSLTPCGECASCRLVHAHTHPDLLVLLPEALRAGLGWETAEAGDSESRASKTKPSREIKVDALREAVAFAQQTSSRGRAKVVLVFPADRMNAIAANTLLKTLEEPPGQARFVLGTGAPQALLPTIRSRCQTVRLAPPQRPAAEAWLAQQGVADAAVLLAAAGQQPLTALELSRQGIDARLWQGLPQQVARGQGAAFSGWTPPLLLDTLQKLCHDALCVAVGAPTRYFDAAAFAGLHPSHERLTEWARELRETARHADHPWNAGLMTEALVTQARRALHSPR